MENFDQPIDVGMGGGTAEGLQITSSVRQYWHQSAKWAMFFAVLLFIVFGLVSLIGLLTAFSGGAVGLISGIFFVGIYAVLIFFPGLYYYRFSTQMKEALNNDDSGMLDQSFLNLRRFYQFVGILMIVLIALTLIFLVVFGAAMMNMGSGMPIE
jgi:hypothetical protein